MHTVDKHILTIRDHVVWVPSLEGIVSEGGITLIASCCRLCHISDFVGRTLTFQNDFIVFVENSVTNFICAPDEAPQNHTLPKESRQGMHFQRYVLF